MDGYAFKNNLCILPALKLLMFEQLHGRRGEGRAEGNERVNACGGGAVDLEYEEREKTRDCRLAKIEMILLSIQTSMQGKGKGEEGEGRGRGKGEKGKKNIYKRGF